MFSSEFSNEDDLSLAPKCDTPEDDLTKENNDKNLYGGMMKLCFWMSMKTDKVPILLRLLQVQAFYTWATIALHTLHLIAPSPMRNTHTELSIYLGSTV